VDTAETRKGFSNYLAEVTYFDSQVGELVGLLDQSPQRDNTLVIVLSEQGNGFPFAKWTCYDAGLASACIVRWPGKVKPGSVSDALVEYVDVVPTFLEAAGVVRPDILDGRSFVPVLTGAATTHKTHVFGLQTTRGINGGSEYFGIRSVRDARYRYIRNLTPEATFRNGVTSGQPFKSWKKMAEGGDSHARRLVHDYQHRRRVTRNCSIAKPTHGTAPISRDDPKFAPQLAALRTQLESWMKQQGDEGQPTEMKAFERNDEKG
jgi:N-sulfoglucosamine sulfohydrolase